MTTSSSRARRCRSLLVPFLSLAVLASLSISVADEPTLKNGAKYRGNLQVMNTLSGNAIPPGAIQKKPEPYNIARIDNGWQRIYFSRFQLQPEIKTISNTRQDEVSIKPPPKQSKRVNLKQAGVVSLIQPFDEFGRRRIEITTPTEKHDILQAITKVTPDHVMVDSTNTDWKFGLALKTIPFETIDKMLRLNVDQNDVNARLGIARLYIEAGFYEKAYDELTAIGEQFPTKKAIVQQRQSALTNFFGQEILLKLNVKKRAGQHVQAQIYANHLLKLSLTGPVVQDVQSFIKSYDDARQSIERVKVLLAEWQSKLNDAKKEKRLQPLRSEVNDELDFETLGRLDAFLKAEVDTQFNPSQRLGLAYSGWVLGAANAVPDLDQALRIWEARQDVIDYLKSDDPSVHDEILKRLKSAENVSPTAVFNMAAQLLPWKEVDDSQYGVPISVETKTSDPVSYTAILPAEYTRHHSCPLLILLRSASNTAEQTAVGWAAGEGYPDYGHQRGYIVVAPDYVEKGATEYSFGTPAHTAVLNCLADARMRFSVDSDRVYLAGQGMGGDAAFDIGMAHPDEFAGVVSVGGKAINYCVYNWSNAEYTSIYAVGNGYDVEGNRDPASNAVFERLLNGGIKYDFTLAEYYGRTGESVRDEIPKFFDWMELPSHVRRRQPSSFSFKALRTTDNSYFWMKTSGLAKDFILPNPPGHAQKVVPMNLEVNITAGKGTIKLNKSAGQNFSLRLTPDLVDFDKQIHVEVGSRRVLNEHVSPDFSAVLEDLRLRGDRKRLPLAVLTQ